MVLEKIQVSTNGRWASAPALGFDGRFITAKGRLLKLAGIHDEWWLSQELEEPEQCIAVLKKQNSKTLRADIFTFTQKIPGSAPRYPYFHQWDSVAAVITSDFKAWWEGLPQETRKNVRRSQKRGVEIRIHEFNDELIAGIAGVNNDSPMRQGKLNVHYGKSLELVRKDHESFVERSDFICAHFENEMIGYLKLVYRGEVAAILNLAMKAGHSDKRPANALIATAVERCSSRKISHMTYGYFNYGKKTESPLREFKIRNGFREFLTPRYYVPLTNWGGLALKLNLHRGILEVMPQSLITRYGAARSKWYTLKEKFPKPV